MIEINLLPEELKTADSVKKPFVGIKSNYFLYLLPSVIGLLLIAHLLLSVANICVGMQLERLTVKWGSLEPQRKTLQKFKDEHTLISKDINEIRRLTEERINWSGKLNALSLNLPSGVWFNEVTITPQGLTLQGTVISLQQEEMSLINKFISSLKGDGVFIRDFKNIELTSVQKKTIGGFDTLDFALLGILDSR